MTARIFCLVAMLLLAGCRDFGKEKFVQQIPPGFPAPFIPKDNPMTAAKVELGKKLFFDPILSSTNAVSCGSCHDPAMAFASHDRLAPGINHRQGTRNVPSLVNIAYHPYLFAEGEVKDLETQVIAPIQHADEMDLNLRLVMDRLMEQKIYRDLFRKAFDSKPTPGTLVRAIACYERSLLSANAPYDHYIAGDTSALNAGELRGMKLFFSERTRCSHCHGGPNFTHYKILNNGLYEVYGDPGKMRGTEDPRDAGKFKTPSLRNVGETWPYMHDGSLPDLEAVVAFYNSGGQPHPNKSSRIRPLQLDASEQKDLVAFLRTLTDNDLVHKTGIFRKN